MTRVEGGTSNIINGVSRQPSEIRLTSQLEESVNQFPTLTRGLVPRNPTRLRGRIGHGKISNSITHLIDRDETEQYVVTVTPSGVSVCDLSGNVYQVKAPDGYGYLANATSSTLEALSVADHTFILNKNVTVEASPELSPAYLSGGLVHVVQGDYGETYQVFIDDALKARMISPGAAGDTATLAQLFHKHSRTSSVAKALYNGQGASWFESHNLTANLDNSVWQLAYYDTVIHVWRKDNQPFSLTVTGGDTRIRAHMGSVPRLSDLPRKAPDGFGIKITGSQESNYDDYYVKFVHPTDTGEGSWKETLAPQIPYKINAATMPHILVREADGTFTFKQAEWAARECGDEETNPWPSFVGGKISGMVFFKNRMGFHGGESVSMSRNGEFFNFFIESVLTSLDSDPVDVSIAYNDVSDIHHATAFGGEMVLFTSSVPFRLATNGELFTPKSVSIEPLLNVKASRHVKPVEAGDKLYFVSDKHSGTFVHEMNFDEASGTATAPTLTDHVQGYIPPDVHLMVADNELKILCLVSKQQPNTLYTYKWLWVGQEKVQAAWQKWVIEAPILAMRFFDEELVLVTERTSVDNSYEQEVLMLNCHEAYDMDKPFVPCLDRLVELVGTYNPAKDVTLFTLPYKPKGIMALNGSQTSFGLELEIVSINSQDVYLQGNITEPVLFGFPYDSYCTLSKLHHRSTDNQGAYGNAIAGTQLTVANLMLDTGTCAYLTATLERDYRKPFIYQLSVAQSGTKTAKVGGVVMGKINKNLSIMSRADDYRLTIGAKSPYPYSLLSYRWTGRIYHAAY